MKIAFTICSNNYFSQAKTLSDTLILHNPEYYFYIIIVDELLQEKKYCINVKTEIIPISSILESSRLNELINKFNIIELNTAVKASCFKFLKQLNPNHKFIFYFDPDIMVFNSFTQLESYYDSYDIILTPHVLYPKLAFENKNIEISLLKYVFII